MTAKGPLAARAAIAEGGTDFEATLAALQVMEEFGSGLITDGPYVVTGSGSTLAHARGSSRRAKRGELASTMMTASIGRYQSPLERSFPIGEVDARTREVIGMSAEVTQKLLDELRPGITSAQADRIARDYWGEHALSEGFVHRRPTQLASSSRHCGGRMT